MKENLGSINHILFSQLFGEVAGRIFQGQGSQLRLRCQRFMRHIFPEVVATLIIGLVFFACISLFLYQLAEKGW